MPRSSDIRPLATDPQAFAKAFWQKVRPLGVAVALLGAGFPCRELSQVNQSRKGLDHGDTARFEEAKILFKAILDKASRRPRVEGDLRKCAVNA